MTNFLTDEEIDELEAGPKTDMLVAEFVMGEPMPTVKPYLGPMLTPVLSAGGNWIYLSLDHQGKDCQWVALPVSMEANLALRASAEVLEIFRHFSNYTNMYDGTGSPSHLWSFFNPEAPQSSADALSVAKSPELALCRAALKVAMRSKRSSIFAENVQP